MHSRVDALNPGCKVRRVLTISLWNWYLSQYIDDLREVISIVYFRKIKSFVKCKSS